MVEYASLIIMKMVEYAWIPWGQPDENDKGIAAHKITIKIIF